MLKYLFTSNILLLHVLLFSSCSWAKTKSDALASTPQTGKESTSFEWRSIYSPTSAADAKANPKQSMHVDWCWGLWGHNLKKIFKDYKGDDVYAVVNGKREKSQYCFSSPATYKAIESFILNEYGEGKSSYHERICIIPNDNKTVCQCAKCKQMGCSEANATPAVADLLSKLGNRFPMHCFFMAGYKTTLEAPTKKLPGNVGVFLSTMDIPMRYIFNESNGFKKFDARLKEWQKAVSKVYVWEYNRNFDDYLTPYPCLSIMQQRLKYYQQSGITGIFINGSGYDYSSFDDLHTRVLNELMTNVNQDVDELIKRTIRELYPETAESVIEFYLPMEKEVREKNIILPYYGTVEDELTYIHADEFNHKWIDLDKQCKTLKKAERKRLSELLTAMAFTRMELTRITGDKSDFENIVDVLAGYFETPGLQNYRETNGNLDHYIEDCRKLHRAPEIKERR